jgi:hypothetical protein
MRIRFLEAAQGEVDDAAAYYEEREEGRAMTSSTNLIEPFDASNPFHSLPPKSSPQFDGVC